MLRYWNLAVCMIMICCLPAVISTPAAGQATHDGKRIPPQAALAELGWLAGHWSGDMWGGRFFAYYSTPEGGKILSHSKLVKDGQVTFYEFEVFERREETLHLQPYPGGKAATGFPFKMHDPKARRAVFENPRKDYPTRIEYHRVADDRLVITLSDPFGSSGKSERFDLKRLPE